MYWVMKAELEFPDKQGLGAREGGPSLDRKAKVKKYQNMVPLGRDELQRQGTKGELLRHTEELRLCM